MSMFLLAQEDGSGFGAGLLCLGFFFTIVYLACRPKRVKSIDIEGKTKITPKY